MYPSYFVLFFFGVSYFQLQTIVISCPPQDDTKVPDAKVIQFCSGFEVISHNIYIDSSDASTRVTNCTCNFSITNNSTVLLTTTSDKTSDCRTNIKYGIVDSSLTYYCGAINQVLAIQRDFNYTLMLTNGQSGLTTYCLRLLTDNSAIKISMECFRDMFYSKTPTTSSITTDQTTDIYSTYGTSTNGTSTSKTNEQNSTVITRPTTTTTINATTTTTLNATTTTTTTTTTTKYLKIDDNQENAAIKINMKCFKDSFFSTKETTTAFEETTLARETTAFVSTIDTFTAFQSTKERETISLIPTSASQSPTTTEIKDNGNNQGAIIPIILPCLFGGILLIGTVIVTGALCFKRRYFRKDIYEQPLSHIDLHCYENQVMSNITMGNNGSRNTIDNGVTTITENTGDDYTKLQLENNENKNEAGT